MPTAVSSIGLPLTQAQALDRPSRSGRQAQYTKLVRLAKISGLNLWIKCDSNSLFEARNVHGTLFSTNHFLIIIITVF